MVSTVQAGGWGGEDNADRIYLVTKSRDSSLGEVTRILETYMLWAQVGCPSIPPGLCTEGLPLLHLLPSPHPSLHPPRNQSTIPVSAPRKVLNKLNFSVPEDVMRKIAQCAPGVVELVLIPLRQRLEERQRRRKQGIGSLQVPPHSSFLHCSRGVSQAAESSASVTSSEKGAWLKGAHSGRDVPGSGQPKVTADSGWFFQELTPQDGTDYMDVGKVAFTCLPFQEELFSCPSFLWGKGWDYREGEDRTPSELFLYLPCLRFVPEGPRGRCPRPPGTGATQVRKLRAPDLTKPDILYLGGQGEGCIWKDREVRMEGFQGQ